MMVEQTFVSWTLALAYSRRRNVLLVGLRSGTAVQLGASTLKRLATFEPPTPTDSAHAFARNAITTCAFTPDGTVAACGTKHGTVFLLDRNMRPFWADRAELAFAFLEYSEGWRELLPELDQHDPDPVAECAFSPDGDTGVVARLGGLTLLERAGTQWPIRRSKSWAVRRRIPMASHPMSCAFSPDGRTLAVGDDVGDVELRDATLATPIRRIGRHTEPVTCCAWSPDGTLLATGSFDQDLRIWRTDVAPSRMTRVHLNARVNDCAFTFDGKYLATVSGWGPHHPSTEGYEFTLLVAATGEVILTTPFSYPPVGVCALGEKYVFAVAVGSTVRTVTAERL